MVLLSHVSMSIGFIRVPMLHQKRALVNLCFGCESPEAVYGSRATNHADVQRGMHSNATMNKNNQN